jgi:hypothetical protein
MGYKEQTLETGDIEQGWEKGTGERMTGEKTWFNTNKTNFYVCSANE